MLPSYDVAVVGGGIYGCSVAKQLSETELEVCLLEKEHHLARHQSGRNSGTLHIGVVTEADVEPGSRLARFTIDGTRQLKAYCRAHDLPMLDRGIMKVGTTPAECEKLRQLYDRARALELDVQFLDDQAAIHEREPQIHGRAGIYSPESATVDAGAITAKLAQQAWENGVEFLMGAAVERLQEAGDGVRVESTAGDVHARYVVNAAGVRATALAEQLGAGTAYDAVPFRGVYYELVPDRRELVASNVYPTSVGPSFQVGVHFTRRPDNRVIVGPTGMIALGPETYGKTAFDLASIKETLTSSHFRAFVTSPGNLRLSWAELNKTYRKRVFLERCRRLIPDLESADLHESYVGISHWLFDAEGNRVNDPVIECNERAAHILLPQPGFTAALPVGEYVADEVCERL